MKRIFVILTIVALMLTLLLCGCRAATKSPIISAVQSAIGTLPGVSSPSPSMSASASPLASVSASGLASVSPSASASKAP